MNDRGSHAKFKRIFRDEVYKIFSPRCALMQHATPDSAKGLVDCASYDMWPKLQHDAAPTARVPPCLPNRAAYKRYVLDECVQIDDHYPAAMSVQIDVLTASTAAHDKLKLSCVQVPLQAVCQHARVNIPTPRQECPPPPNREALCRFFRS